MTSQPVKRDDHIVDFEGEKLALELIELARIQDDINPDAENALKMAQALAGIAEDFRAVVTRMSQELGMERLQRIAAEREAANNKADLDRLENALKNWESTADERVSDMIWDVEINARAEAFDEADGTIAANIADIAGVPLFGNGEIIMEFARALTILQDEDEALSELMKNPETRQKVAELLDKFKAGLIEQGEIAEALEAEWDRIKERASKPAADDVPF